MNKNSLDQDAEDNWKLEDGVRTSTLNAILKKIVFHIIHLVF